MKEFTIAERKIGPNQPPFIIAEMSGNHNQSLDKALEIVEAAAAAGVDALKLQTYTAETMTLDVREGEFFIDDENSLWKGNSLYDLYKEAYTPWEWHERIFQRCKELGLIAFSSPFDETAVDFLESLDVPCYKIASFENVDIPLIRKVARTGKPVIMSTGMASAAELDEAVRVAREEGCENLILLKCTSTYPASPENSNLRTLPHLKELFGTQVGLSDHTMGVGVGVASVVLGATVIEKHFTLSRDDGGVDAAFSMEPKEMKALVEETKKAWLSLGTVKYGPTKSEEPSLKHRRSLYVSSDLKVGDVLTKENVRAIRPGLGMPTKYINLIIGKKVVKEVKKGDPLTFDVVMEEGN
ncbi:pseudaminic acid synthase [Evansella cellulosilytica]|uniref:Pseudaminic acid synthase n=1 Tax=Evansella cellulosilytica (strain ATCC 21833 / DSM 2522 / FERM P-1141 / JCM 9156 / N-4) TaxID=649639 RepID=E6TS77_EVAC2|nr:pseudaminic acid synthase [Evansella cellulosilytica]ADU31846.1 pseudaminic acid synthase [Evansella cellulosilytica DSM 2522]